MSCALSPASAMALRLASAASVSVRTPDLRVNAVQPMPAMAVLSLIGCSGIEFSPEKIVAILLSDDLAGPYHETADRQGNFSVAIRALLRRPILDSEPTAALACSMSLMLADLK